MNLNTSKTILKIFGIISIIFGILGILTGVLAIVGGIAIAAGGATGEVATNSTIAGAIAVLGIIGLIAIVGSIIELLSGIFSVKAAKDISKIMPAWWFAVLGVISSLISIVSMIMQKSSQPIEPKNMFGAIVALLTSVLIFFAAETIKKAAGK